MTPRLATWRERSDGPLLVLSIGSLPLLLLELKQDELPIADRRFLFIVNVAVLVAFAVNYVVEFTLARNRSSFARHEWTDLLIVLAQAIALVPNLGAVGAVRVFRAGRLWRAIAVISRVLAIGGASARDGRATLRRHAARFALYLAGFTMLTGAVAFTLAEDVGENGEIHSFFDALWWSASTITTVGAGALSPVTVAGRLSAIVVMFVGISSAGIITAKFAEFLVRTAREDAAAEQPTAPLR
jgi:voltage-gated potassium channel